MNINLFLIIIIVILLISKQWVLLFIIFIVMLIITIRYRYNVKRRYFYQLTKALSLLDNNKQYNDNELKTLCDELLKFNEFFYNNFYDNEKYINFYKLFTKAWGNIYIYTIINNLIDTRDKLESIKAKLNNLNITLHEQYIKFDYYTAHFEFIRYNICDIEIFDILNKKQIIEWCNTYKSKIQELSKDQEQHLYNCISYKFSYFNEIKKVDNDDIFYFYTNCCIEIIFLYLINDKLLNNNEEKKKIHEKLNELFEQLNNYYNEQKDNISESSYKNVKKLNDVINELVFNNENKNTENK